MRAAGGRARRVLRVLLSLSGIAVMVLLLVGVLAYARSTNECYTGERANPNPGSDMRAIVYCDYGPPSVLRLETIAKPMPADSQVLVRVRAAAVNPLDWHYMRGTPYIARATMGLRRPKEIQLGVDFAGEVIAVGAAVTRFAPGDEVFGARTGALAEYVTIRAERVVAKPRNVTFEEAAAVPVAGLTALQALRDQARVGPGQKVLINGASGGVGTFAVQIAKSLGAEVTGVSSTRNVGLVRSLGADHVIDYTAEDFTEGTLRYDVIIDNVGNHAVSDLIRVLEPGGRYVMVGGPSGKWIAPLPRVLTMVVRGWFTDHELRFFISQLNTHDLEMLADLMQTGAIKAVIDRRYTLVEAPEAIEYLETGRARGKVIVLPGGAAR